MSVMWRLKYFMWELEVKVSAFHFYKKQDDNIRTETGTLLQQVEPKKNHSRCGNFPGIYSFKPRNISNQQHD